MPAHSNANSIFVTGFGMASAAGLDAASSLESMLSGSRRPSNKPSIFESGLGKSVFECPFDPASTGIPSYERTLALATLALAEAMASASLAPSELAGKRVGVVLGSTVACMLNSVDFYAVLREDGVPDLTPLELYLNGDISKRVAERLGAEGPRVTIANACSSGANAIAAAFAWLTSGLCDIVVAGGADELSLIPYCGFNSLQIMDSEPCLPFDMNRRGLTLGEGAGVLILETEGSMRRRGVAPKARLVACGSASDAYHLTGPHPEGRGLKRAVEMALSSADVSPDRIDYVNAHGTGTRDNDKIEGRSLFDLFGNKLRYSSTKYYTGHTLAAAGAIEACVCVAGLSSGRFPGTPLETPDPDIPKPPVSAPILHQGGYVLSTSMAFGGTCVALMFAPPELPDGFRGSPPSAPRSGLETGIETEGIAVASCGIVGPRGRGLESLMEALQDSASIGAGDAGVFSVSDDFLADPSFKRLRRRADRISLMAVAAARDAVEAANLAERDVRGMAVVFATSFGSHDSTFKFLDSLLDYGEAAPSPTSFSNSVHNAPTFHITQNLGIQGPSVTITAFDSPFSEALTHAKSILISGAAERTLLVVGDEASGKMRRISDLWTESRDEPPISWGEGAVAFILEKRLSGALETSGRAVPASVLADDSASFADSVEKIFGRTLFNDAVAFAASFAFRGE